MIGTSKKDSVSVLIPGDLHLTAAGRPNHQTALWMVEQANNFIRPDFVQFIGDNVQNGAEEEFRLFNELANQLRPPWYALVGDHDAGGESHCLRFRQYVGEPYSSTTMAGFRFIRLNTQEGRPVGISADQLGWFQSEARAAIESGEKIVLFQHNYPYQIWEEFAGCGINDWKVLVQTFPIQAIITGHTHYWQVANDGRNAVVATRSIGDPEGGPPGFTLAVFDCNDFAVSYRTIDDRGPMVLITHPREKILATGSSHVVKGPDEVRAWVWSHSTVETVAYNVDDGDWTPLHYDSGQTWRASLPGHTLSKGSHRLRVRVVAKQTAKHEIEFAVDPTGRYTAVPMVRPLVAGTAFC